MIQHDIIIEKTWLKKHKEIINLVQKRILFTLNYCNHEEDSIFWLSEHYTLLKRLNTVEKKDMIVSEEKSQKMKWKLTEILWRGTVENSDSIEKLN